MRDILRRKGEDAYDEVKKHLPAVAVSGTIQGARKNAAEDGRLLHSGLLQIDIDQKDNGGLDVSEMKKKVISSPYAVAVWTSPSGRGVKAIVRIEADVSSHALSFLAAEQHFVGLGLRIDKATKDVGRLMLVSSDPDLWINPEVPPILPKSKRAADPPEPRRQTSVGSEDESRSVDEVGKVLFHIKGRQPYEVWARISWAVMNSLGEEAGIGLLKEWAPEEIPGEYSRLRSGAAPKEKVGFGTLVYYAKQHGYVCRPEIPDDVLPLPGGGITHSVSSKIIFAEIALHRRYFIRGNVVVEIDRDERDKAVIKAVTPERFVDYLGTLDKRVAKRERISTEGGEGKPEVRNVWRTQNMSAAAARVALQSDAARELLPPLRRIVNCPIIVELEVGGCEVVGYGYTDHGGGTFVASDIEIECVPGGVATAVALIKHLFHDFRFADPPDLSRAVAGLISPALKFGGVLARDFPIDVSEADLSQAGKSYRLSLVPVLYNEIPEVVTPRRGGVGSFDESLSNALLEGSSFISLDNIRGDLDCPLLESALRGYSTVQCRGFRASGRVDVTAVVWQLSTNGAGLTPDLANRSVITRIRKQPPGYVFQTYAGGDLKAHLANRRGLYLGAVFEVVREWVAQGKPQTDESRHDFREWTRALDWIVQHIFRLPPLMDGHREQQVRTSQPGMQWLRQIILAAGPSHFGKPLTASHLVSIAEEHGIEFPGGPSRESGPARAGKILGRLFADCGSESVVIDGYKINRSQQMVRGDHGPKTQFVYSVSCAC